MRAISPAGDLIERSGHGAQFVERYDDVISQSMENASPTPEPETKYSFSGFIAWTTASGLMAFASLLLLQLTHPAFLDSCDASFESANDLLGWGLATVGIGTVLVLGRNRVHPAFIALGVLLAAIVWLWIIFPAGDCGLLEPDISFKFRLLP